MSGTVGEVGERELVRRIVRRVGANAMDVLVGPGDDAAVVTSETDRLIVTVDRLREGVHFESGWLSSAEIGERAIATAASDVFAMGARPRAIVVALEVPAAMETVAFDELVAGLAAGADRAGAAIVGGDVGIGATLGAFTTVLGGAESAGRLLTRAAAKPGDEAWVIGHLGHAAVGRTLLAEGPRTEIPEPLVPFVEAFAAPATPRDWCLAAAERPEVHAMMDISDGLALDLHRMTEASGIGCELDPEVLNAAVPEFACSAAGSTARALALGGGDDYAMLCAVAPDAASDLWTVTDAPAHRVGRFIAKSGVWLAGAERVAVAARGWDPFTEHDA